MTQTDITSFPLDALTLNVYANDKLRKVRFEDNRIFRELDKRYYYTIPQLKHLLDVIDKEFFKIASKEAYSLTMSEEYKGRS